MTQLELLTIMESSDSIKEVLWKLYGNRSRAYNRLKKLVDSLGLEVEYQELKHRAYLTNKFSGKIPNEQLFVKGHKRKSAVRKRILSENLIPYVCSVVECPSRTINQLWCGKSMVLDLDHIDGDNSNQLLENLRFLCKNCHSQTPTYGSRNIAEAYKAKKHFCMRCENSVSRKTNIFCLECAQSLGKTVTGLPRKRKVKTAKEKVPKVRQLRFEVTKEDLEKLIQEMPMTKIGKLFGVSDKAISKRAKKLGIDLEPRRGYWTKQKNNKSDVRVAE